VKFSTAIHCSEGIFDYVHIDVWELTKTTSIGDNHYFMSFIDDYSRRCWVYTRSIKGSPGVVCGVKKEYG